MTTDFTFGVTLNPIEKIDSKIVRATLHDVDQLLKIIERTVNPGRHPRAHWGFVQSADLIFTASVNGASPETLSRVVAVAQEAFQVADRAAKDDTTAINWPDELTADARTRIANILARLEQLESVTIEATGFDTIEIRRARVDAEVESPVAGRVLSSVDGVLEMLSRRESSLRGGIRETGTGRYVRCTFDPEKWGDFIREEKLWDTRVTVYGRVSYDEHGAPVSIVDVTKIEPQATGITLSQFEGVAPGLFDGPFEDYLVRMRPSG